MRKIIFTLLIFFQGVAFANDDYFMTENFVENSIIGGATMVGVIAGHIVDKLLPERHFNQSSITVFEGVQSVELKNLKNVNYLAENNLIKKALKNVALAHNEVIFVERGQLGAGAMHVYYFDTPKKNKTQKSKTIEAKLITENDEAMNFGIYKQQDLKKLVRTSLKKNQKKFNLTKELSKPFTAVIASDNKPQKYVLIIKVN